MTTLLVTPLDPAAPGSYRKRQKLLSIIRQAESTTARIEAMQAQIKADEGLAAAFASEMQTQSNSLMDVQIAVDALIVQNVRTDDGSPVEAALDEISANDFDRLLKALLGNSSIPNSKSAS